MFEGITPILRVQSLPVSLDYYVKVLGFKVNWQSPGIMAGISRDRCSIMLCEGDQGNPGTWVWIGVEDAEALFEEYKAKRATIRQPTTNYPWAYEVQIEDPDQHVLRFGSDPKTDAQQGLEGHETITLTSLGDSDCSAAHGLPAPFRKDHPAPTVPKWYTSRAGTLFLPMLPAPSTSHS
jgi:predicted lactoylglutathione lyase